MATNTPGLISCRVVNSEGQPVAGARVFFVSGPGSYPEIAALTDANGFAVLSAPAPGTYEIQVVAEGFAPQTVAATLPEGEATEQTIVLQST
jgi:hypothetical protein